MTFIKPHLSSHASSVPTTFNLIQAATTAFNATRSRNQQKTCWDTFHPMWYSVPPTKSWTPSRSLSISSCPKASWPAVQSLGNDSTWLPLRSIFNSLKETKMERVKVLWRSVSVSVLFFCKQDNTWNLHDVIPLLQQSFLCFNFAVF